jgi:hypothetical protein
LAGILKRVHFEPEGLDIRWATHHKSSQGRAQNSEKTGSDLGNGFTDDF